MALAIGILAGCTDSTTQTNGTPTNDTSPSQPATGNSGGTGETVGSGGTDDSGNTDDNENSGDTTGTGDEDATGGTDDSGETTVATCTSSAVGIAFQAINATVISDPDRAPEKLIDGCVDRAHGWSGDNGSIVTLDAGAVHQMQGIYIWSTFARMEWIKIESSADGLNWVTDWHAVPTKPANGPVYYSLDTAGPKRYVRLSGFGSDVNSWTNLAEVRWSVTGYNVSGNRVWRSPVDYGGFYTYSVDNQLTLVSHAHADVMWIRTGRYCERIAQNKLVVIDATGQLDSFSTFDEIAGVSVYRTDWNHWDGAVSIFTGPDQLWEINSHFYERVGPLPNRHIEEPGCHGIGSGDPEYNVGATYSNITSGYYQNPFINFY